MVAARLSVAAVVLVDRTPRLVAAAVVAVLQERAGMGPVVRAVLLAIF